MMLQISAHPLVWAQSNVCRPWALFRETTVKSVWQSVSQHIYDYFLIQQKTKVKSTLKGKYILRSSTLGVPTATNQISTPSTTSSVISWRVGVRFHQLSHIRQFTRPPQVNMPKASQSYCFESSLINQAEIKPHWLNWHKWLAIKV